MTATLSTRGGYRLTNELTLDFKSFGEQAKAVSKAETGNVDIRLKAPTTYASESIGEDGGFAVAPAFRNDLLLAASHYDLMALADVTEIVSGSLQIASDSTPPWASNGVQATWQAEAASLTHRKPGLTLTSMRPMGLRCFVPVTDELLDDAPALGNYLQRRASLAISYQVGAAMIAGSGAGQPLGIVNAAASINVAKDGGQTADTITATNIAGMWARLWSPSRQSPSTVWLVSPTADAYLVQKHLQGTTANLFDYDEAGNRRIFGRRVIVHDGCSLLGDRGDIILADLSQYAIGRKQMRNDLSIQIWFNQSVSAFRFSLRMNGQPWWSAPADPRVGSDTLSPFVTLADRA